MTQTNKIDAPPLDNVSNNGGIGPRARKTNAGDGDGCIGSKGGGDASDDDDDDHDGMPTVAALNEGSLAETTITKKKKKSKKSKKKKASASKQTSPPTIALDKLFPTGNYPAGRILDYASHHGTARRTESSGSLIPVAFDLEETTFLNNYRKAAEVHRQTRKWAQEFARPGVGLTSIADGVDASIRALLDNDGLGPGQGLKSGPGFPTGLSLNNIVAHYTPNPGFKDVILQKSDVMKVDFGVHINGWIVDSAFTMSFDPQYDNLLAAVKDATDTGIKVIYVLLFYHMISTDKDIRQQVSMSASATSAPRFKKPWSPMKSRSTARSIQSRQCGISLDTTSSNTASTVVNLSPSSRTPTRPR